MNNSNSESSSDDNEEDDDTFRDFEEDEEEQNEAIKTKALIQKNETSTTSVRSSIDSNESFKRNATASIRDESSSSEFSLSINWADFEIESQLDFAEKKTFLNKSVKQVNRKQKYKGARRMVVKLQRLDLSVMRDGCCELRKSHYCQYFKTGGPTDKCNHRFDDHISQGICLNCDFKVEHKDSLNHMAFASPIKMTPDNLEKPIFGTPTANTLEDEKDESDDTTTLKIENENCNSDDDTLLGGDEDIYYEFDDDEAENNSADDSVHTNSSLDSLFELSDEDFTDTRERVELKWKRTFQELIPKPVETVSSKNRELKKDELEDKGVWFCPIEKVPLTLNDNLKQSTNDSIICYSAENTKKWASYIGHQHQPTENLF